MREYAGIRPKLAQEFTGFVGTSKMFRSRFRGPTDALTRIYSPEEIRQIRMGLMGIPLDTPRSAVIPPILNFRMSKGGTGKTTICGNTASCLASMGYRVLMIDGDPQASLSQLFGLDWTKHDPVHIGELMRRANTGQRTDIDKAVIPIYPGGMLDLIAADINMANADSWIINAMNREQLLTRLLTTEIEFFSRYDAILIDSAPSSSLLTLALMVASKTMIAVVMPEGQSLKALDVLEANIKEMNAAWPNREYGVHIIINRYNQTKRPHQEVLQQIITGYKKQMNDTIIRDFIGFLRETVVVDNRNGGPVLEHEPNSVGARDIIDVTKSLIAFYDIHLPNVTASRAV